ncbi:Histone transcription regulator 3 [Pleurostoma richardsiae]|uniref:Histone transcription regulator 3 homolog n=1 Tax=Pleurostoma richardsiae TaxID=41990 RepID=A0AA38RPZ5_9PEZI|nr:Histone transcription regulator 3 [Pleurostoma richardsiae]
MPAFSAINLEPEETVDEEIDTTREIQIDDALKLFQTALKLHAQGPRFFDEAADAYDALFKSEIFRFPENTTEYERTERTDNPFALEAAYAPGLDITGSDADGSGTSLAQALYLSYRNHGQFLLDRIRHKKRAAGEAVKDVFDQPEVLDDARDALYDFTEALDRDPSDADLWRRAARAAAFLKSSRTSRYCLEAAVELDDDPAVVEVEPPSLAEGFAGEQLKRQLQVLADDISLTHPIMTPFLRKELPAMLKRYLDPLPFLPDPTKDLAVPKPLQEETSASRLVISVPKLSWADLGMSLVQFVAEHGLSGQGLVIEIPGGPDDEDLVQMEVDRQLQPPDESAVITDAAVVQSPVTTSIDLAKDARPTPKEEKAHAETPAAPETSRRSLSLPSRKRSVSVAGLQEPADGEAPDGKRSKRTRRRETAAAEELDETKLREAQLQPFQGADQNLFQLTKNVLENLGVTDKATVDRIGEILDSCATEDRTAKISNIATVDLRDNLASFDEDAAKILLNKKDVPTLGLNAFLEHSKSGSQRAVDYPVFDERTGLRSFVKEVNAGWYTIQDIAFEWVKRVSHSYDSQKWSDTLKTAVVQVISRLDEPLYDRIIYELGRHPATDKAHDRAIDSLVLMLFELYLDVYERITNPNSVVDFAIRTETKGRLGRWLDLASEIVRSRSTDARDDLSLRFLWACVFSTTLSEGVPRDHVLACWTSLRDFLAEARDVDIGLPNNAVMSEISSGAADREISKLTTMDFFLGLFQEEMSDPVSVIETLEPVLNPTSVFVTTGAEEDAGGEDANGISKSGAQMPITDVASQSLKDLWKFLLGSSTDLRLFLWSRLSDAYGSISYTTKQFSCLLKSIEMIVSDFEQDPYVKASPEARKALCMKLLRSIDDLMISALSLALNDNSAFDIIDEEHIVSTSSALAKLSCTLHVAAMYEDEIRIGISQPPSKSSTFESLLQKLREMQVRTWSLQYTVLKVGINQLPSVFPHPDNDLAEYLNAVHQVLGLRKACKASNKIFLKMMRIELLKQKNIENWEDYLGQVLFDLHGLKLGVGVWEVQDHGCPTEKLEKRIAMQLAEKITVLAHRMSMKDLLKSDLKTAIEHMQQAIAQPKSTPQMIHNLRNFTEYLKKPIHPLRLYQALTGNVTLDAVTVNTPESNLAKHGWFFLLGMIALTRFKGVDLNRRQTPGATDDLRIGATFLRLQLQFTPDRWDAWFRLAECFDYELDEAVLWTADKMNKDRAELVKFQRNSIHCYTLALSHSQSFTPQSEEDEEALYQLYHNFGMRMYASSREPFTMEPFQHADQERFFIENMGYGTFKRIVHGQMSDYKVWKYAAGLFKLAMAKKPKDWRNPYMLSKCLWKMYRKSTETLDEKDKQHRPTVQTIIHSLLKTVEVASLLPKPRHGQDPLLEPHYKIVSIIHKLVVAGDLPAQEGVDILRQQPYGVQGDEVRIVDLEDWEAFIIHNLRLLRDKDKSNWQHRIIMRHARILFDPDDSSSSDNYVRAKAAFSVLRESMFTKTMTMNVWKCDAERPGRHHVYTERYVRFTVSVLVVLKDRANLELLLRKIRKKGADFYHFNDLWAVCVQAHVRMIRKSYQIPQLEEDVFKSITSEEFEILAERVADWAGERERDHPALNAMKEAVELKKLNGGLMKAGMIDDLINDCYSVLYADISSELPGPEPGKIIEERHRVREEEKQHDSAAEKATNLLDGLLHPGDRDSTRASSEVPHGEKMEKQASGTGEPAVSRRRAAGVRRADVLRKAEQAVLRATDPTPKSAVSAGGSSGRTGRKSRVGSTSSGRNGATTPRPDVDGHNSASDSGEDVEMKDDEGQGAEEHGEDEQEGGEGAQVDAASRSSSPPRSVHDDADDESDLSDLSDVPDDYDRDIPPSLLFPNLRRSVDAGTAVTSGDGEASSSADDEGSSQGSEDAAEESNGSDA